MSPEQGARVARLAKLWSLALQVWSEPDEARGFLWRPHPELARQKPIEIVLRSEFGYLIVEGVLLFVPSVDARMERNILVNPDHPELGQITHDLHRPVWWDARLFAA